MATSFLLGYFSTEGLDITTQTCILTLGFGFLSHCLVGEDWRDIVVKHGFLVALLALGRSFYYLYNLLSPSGTSTSNSNKSTDFISSYSQHVTSMSILGGSFVIMSLTNRYGLLALAYVLIGYTSTSLLSSPSPLTSKYGIGNDFECHAILPNNNKSQRLQKTHAKLAIYSFAVCALLSGLLFSEDKLVNKPAFWPFAVICIACFFLSAMLIASNQRLFHRRASVVGRAVSWAFYICTVGLNAISMLLTPLLEYFPSLRLWDDEEVEGGGSLAARSAPIRTEVGEKDLLLDLFNKLTGESDGRPLEMYHGPIPHTFVNMCSGDEAAGRIAFSKCLQWRRTYSVDKLIDTPQHDFFEILQMSPHAIHGISLDGCAIVYECLNKAQNRELQRRGLTPEKLVRHFMMRNEYIFKRLYNNQDLLEIASEGYKGPSVYPHNQPGWVPGQGPSGAGGGKSAGKYALSPNEKFSFKDGDEWNANGGVFQYCPQRLMTIVDVKDISMSDITTDAISFMRQSGEIMDKYYPEVVERLVIVNAPSWFWTVWRMVARVLPDSVQKKIQIFYDNESLDKFVARDQRPVDYGGTDTRALGDSDSHRAWLSMVDQWEQTSGTHVLRFHEIEEANAQAAAEAAKPRTRSRTRTLSGGPGRSSSSNIAGAGNGTATSSGGNRPKAGAEEETGGWGGWWKSRFSSGSRASKEAYMTEESRYYYDQETGRWTQETGDDDSEEELLGSEYDSDDNRIVPSPKISDYQHKGRVNHEPGLRNIQTTHFSQEKLEEHGLVLAIHAAHVASNMGRAAAARSGGGSPTVSPRHSSNRNNLSGLPVSNPHSPVNKGRRLQMHTGDDATMSGMHGNVASANSSPSGAGVAAAWGGDGNVRYPSLNNYLEHQSLRSVSRLCCLAFAATSVIYGGLLCVVPVWLMSPTSVGGKGYSVLDLGIVFSCAGLIALQCHAQSRWRLRRVALVSPVRSLRIGAGALTLCVLLLNCVGKEGAFFGVSVYAFKPSSFMLAVPVPAIMLTLTAWAAHYLKQSAECLYLLARQRLRDFEWEHTHGDDSEQDFDFQPYLVACSSEICGPLVFSYLLVATHGWMLPYPMDAGFFLPSCACVLVLIYTASWLLALQFVGDFGYIPDDPVHEAGVGALGDFYLLLGRSARSSKSTYVGSRLFNLNLGMSQEVQEI